MTEGRRTNQFLEKAKLFEECSSSVLSVMNNFPSEDKEFQLCTSMFQNMFPTINVAKVNYRDCRDGLDILRLSGYSISGLAPVIRGIFAWTSEIRYPACSVTGIRPIFNINAFVVFHHFPSKKNRIIFWICIM